MLSPSSFGLCGSDTKIIMVHSISICLYFPMECIAVVFAYFCFFILYLGFVSYGFLGFFLMSSEWKCTVCYTGNISFTYFVLFWWLFFNNFLGNNIVDYFRFTLSVLHNIIFYKFVFQITKFFFKIWCNFIFCK